MISLFLYCIIFLFGLAVGSFLNCVIYRFTPHHFFLKNSERFYPAPVSKSKSSVGLTLIELLVVIAIISLLISINVVVVLRYRDNAKDAAIGSNLSQIRRVAAMIYNDQNSYSSFCKAKTLNHKNPDYSSIGMIEIDIMNLNGNQEVNCYATDSAYCVQSPLVLGGAYCVDSIGYAGEKATNCAPYNKKCSL